MGVLGGKAVSVGIHIQHAGEQRAALLQLRDRPRILLCHRPLAEQAGAGKRAVTGDVKQVFYRIGNASQRRQRLAALTLLIQPIGFPQHALRGDGGPGVDGRVMLFNGGQRLLCDVARAEIALRQCLLQLANR